MYSVNASCFPELWSMFNLTYLHYARNVRVMGTVWLPINEGYPDLSKAGLDVGDAAARSENAGRFKAVYIRTTIGLLAIWLDTNNLRLSAAFENMLLAKDFFKHVFKGLSDDQVIAKLLHHGEENFSIHDEIAEIRTKAIGGYTEIGWSANLRNKLDATTMSSVAICLKAAAGLIVDLDCEELEITDIHNSPVTEPDQIDVEATTTDDDFIVDVVYTFAQIKKELVFRFSNKQRRWVVLSRKFPNGDGDEKVIEVRSMAGVFTLLSQVLRVIL